MANGNAHQRATLALVPLAGVGAYLLGYPPGPAAAGALFGLWCHPDRDHAPAKIDGQLPPALGIVGAIIWAAYARLVPHRSPISHWPVVGTIGRVAYLGAPQALLWPDVTVYATAPAVLVFLAVLALSDSLHWLMDR
jgi:hypothetical protein